MEQIANSVLCMSDPQSRDQNLSLLKLDPQRLLKGDAPRLIDEWQIAPTLWDSIRYEVDHRDEMGQFILTRSSVPTSSNEIFHSGTGRFSYLSMRPMSLYESLDSNEEGLFNIFGCLYLLLFVPTPEFVKEPFLIGEMLRKMFEDMIL